GLTSPSAMASGGPGAANSVAAASMLSQAVRRALPDLRMWTSTQPGVASLLDILTGCDGEQRRGPLSGGLARTGHGKSSVRSPGSGHGISLGRWPPWGAALPRARRTRLDEVIAAPRGRTSGSSEGMAGFAHTARVVRFGVH